MEDIKFKLKRTKEKKLLKEQKSGEFHCYFCNRSINIDKDDCSTEYGVFFACGGCYKRYGNPDIDFLEKYE